MIGFVGAGRVGAQAALEVASHGVDDVVLVDIVPGLAEGEALDISHKISETGVDVAVSGSSDFFHPEGSDLVVITAGLARKPGMTRMDLLGEECRDRRIGRQGGGEVCARGVAITVTNPMDVMNYVVLKATGFPKKRVVGMGGVLDLSRFKHVLSPRLGVSRSSIIGAGHRRARGEHAPTPEVHLDRRSSRSRRFSARSEIEATIQSTRQVAIDVIAKKGATVDAPGNAIARMVKAIAWDKKEVLPASTYLEGEYGSSGLSIGVPLELGAEGVERIFELELNEAERSAFMRGAATIKRGHRGTPRI